MPEIPKVSVIMAVHDGEDCIRISVESILNQTFRDFEFIIVDDCSRDNTAEILRSYRDKRITIIRNDINLGQVKSLNKGIKSAKAEYLARIDADDFSYPDRLKRQLEFMEKHPEYAAVGSSAWRMYSRSGKKRLHKNANTFARAVVSLFYTTPFLHVTVMAKRNAVLDAGGYDERFLICADHALWSRLIQKGYRLMSMPDVLVRFNVAAESYSKKNEAIFVSEYTDILKENIEQLTDLQASDDEIKNLSHMFKLIPHNLTDDEFEKARVLFKNIFLNLRSPLKDINIPEKEIIRPLRMVHRHNATYHLRNFNISRSRAIISEGMRMYGFYMPFFVIFIISFLGRFILQFLVRRRNAAYNV